MDFLFLISKKNKVHPESNPFKFKQSENSKKEHEGVFPINIIRSKTNIISTLHRYDKRNVSALIVRNKVGKRIKIIAKPER